MIPEEAWTRKKQNLAHVRIFGSLVLVDIPPEKRSKSDFRKAWEGILIGYNNNTTKHFRVWAPETRQVIMASEPYIDESEQGAKLLLKWPIETSTTSRTKRKALAGEPRPCGRPRKVVEEITDAPLPSSITIGNVPPPPAVTASESTTEQAMSITEANSKVYEPKTYDKAVNDPIYGRQWKDTVDEELFNLESHNTWEFEELPIDRKPIGSK